MNVVFMFDLLCCACFNYVVILTFICEDYHFASPLYPQTYLQLPVACMLLSSDLLQLVAKSLCKW